MLVLVENDVWLLTLSWAVTQTLGSFTVFVLTTVPEMAPPGWSVALAVKTFPDTPTSNAPNCVVAPIGLPLYHWVWK